MGIINRDLDPTQRRDQMEVNLATLATGVTTAMGIVGNDGLVMSCYATAFGLSGAPVVSFSLYRFLTAGFTAIGLGATITTPEFGTSGIASATLIGGVTCLKGDLVVALSGVANTATLRTVMGAVLQPQVDFLKFPGT